MTIGVPPREQVVIGAPPLHHDHKNQPIRCARPEKRMRGPSRSLTRPEHSHIPVRRTTPYPVGAGHSSGELPREYYRSLDPFLALAAVATVTSNLSVGTSGALLPQRDFIHTAKECATLDLLSGGRLVLGVGLGWNREEMEDHGVDPRTRGRLVDEQVAALQEI